MGAIEVELRELRLESLFTRRKFIEGRISCLDINQHDIMRVANGSYYVLSVIDEKFSSKRLRVKNMSNLEDEELSELAETGILSNSNTGFSHTFDSSYSIREVLKAKEAKRRGIISLKRKI